MPDKVLDGVERDLRESEEEGVEVHDVEIVDPSNSCPANVERGLYILVRSFNPFDSAMMRHSLFRISNVRDSLLLTSLEILNSRLDNFAACRKAKINGDKENIEIPIFH